jgi:hypothetical protein
MSKQKVVNSKPSATEIVEATLVTIKRVEAKFTTTKVVEATLVPTKTTSEDC